MKAIRIDEDRINMILPQNVKDSDVSENAKKVLATILNYFAVLNIAKTSGYLVCPNSVLRAAVGIRNNEMLNAIQELIELDLLIRENGKKRTENEKAIASEYRIKWENLTKPIKRKETFEELFSEFIKPAETPLGTAVSNTVTVSDTVSNTITNSVNVSNAKASSNTLQLNNVNNSKVLQSESKQEIKENKATYTLQYNDFKEKVDSAFESITDEEELLMERIKLSSQLDTARAEIGTTVYARCRMYLTRKYEEALTLIN